MTPVPVEIGRRPKTPSRDQKPGTLSAVTSVIIVDDVEALAAETNLGRCNDSNPYN